MDYIHKCIAKGAYFPRMETIEKEVEKIRINRKFAHDVLCGVRVNAQRPNFWPVCDKGLEGSKECQFYQRDARPRRDTYMFESLYEQKRTRITVSLLDDMSG